MYRQVCSHFTVRTWLGDICRLAAFQRWNFYTAITSFYTPIECCRFCIPNFAVNGRLVSSLKFHGNCYLTEPYGGIFNSKFCEYQKKTTRNTITLFMLKDSIAMTKQNKKWQNVFLKWEWIVPRVQRHYTCNTYNETTLYSDRATYHNLPSIHLAERWLSLKKRVLQLALTEQILGFKGNLISIYGMACALPRR